MIPYPVYKLIHLLGVFFVLGSLAGLAIYTANGGTKSKNSMKRVTAILHGIGMFLVLLGGFGMLARTGITGALPGWVWAKLVIWVVFGVLIAFVAKGPLLAKVIWFLLPFLTVFSAYIAIMRPI